MGISNRLTDGLLGLALLGLAVFAWLPDSFFRMVSWPWVLLWQGSFLLVLGGCLVKLRQFDQAFYGLGISFDWLMMGLLACLVITSATASFPQLALQNSLLVICYVVLLYGIRNSQFGALQLCRGVVWVGAIAAIISLALWRPTPDMWLSDNFYAAIRNRFPLGHHNFTGGYFVLILPVAAGLTWLQSGWQRWGYGMITSLVAVALYASGSRGAWLGGVAIVIISLLGGVIRSRGKARVGAIALACLALSLMVLLLASNPRMRALVPTGLWRSTESANISVVTDSPTRDRVFMAQAALNIVREHPILGLGPGNLGRIYERYRPVAAGAGLQQVQQLHNTPLQIVVELGILGALVYVGATFTILRRWWRVQTLSSSQERQLSSIIGIGFVGYGVSSLTDYQLENIPIAATLTLLVAAINQLGKPVSIPLPSTVRRWSSLLLLAGMALMVQFWLRTDLALWLTHQGVNAINQGDLVQADDKFYTAAAIAPWDPTPSALGAQTLSELAQTAEPEDQETLRKEAISLYRQALTVVPNDVWFNQNLAVLAWQSKDVSTAYQMLTKVVQLSPRSKNYSYHLLGLTYQAMGNSEAAVEAFALECLINPQALAFNSWQQELAPLKEAVFARVLQHYQTVLAALGPTPLQTNLQTHITTLRWWADTSVIPSDITEISRLLLQALITIEETPDQAEPLLDRCIAESSGDTPACRLLKAWLRPETYLPDYLTTAELDPVDQEALRDHILTHRNLKDWLKSTTLPVVNNQRVALSLLYRSYYARSISSILVPENLRQFSLPTSLNIFSLTWPRELPPLDELVESVRANALGLPHPTRNHFQLTEPLGP